MADEEKNKTEEETKEDTEHKFDPDSDACGVCGGMRGRGVKNSPVARERRGFAGLVKWYNISFLRQQQSSLADPPEYPEGFRRTNYKLCITLMFYYLMKDVIIKNFT